MMKLRLAKPEALIDINGLTDVYVRDLTAAATVLVSRTPAGSGGNGNSVEAALSPSGGFLVFSSQATRPASLTPVPPTKVAVVAADTLTRDSAVSVTGDAARDNVARKTSK